jgi:hypothetical protein
MDAAGLDAAGMVDADVAAASSQQRLAPGMTTESELTAVRRTYAKLIMATVCIADSWVEEAFATVRREEFLGPGPWPVLRRVGYVNTPDADPVYLYDDAEDRHRQLEEMKARTMAIARGERHVAAVEPKVWFTSTESFAKVLSAGNRDVLRVIAEKAASSLDELARITSKSNLSRNATDHGRLRLGPTGTR